MVARPRQSFPPVCSRWLWVGRRPETQLRLVLPSPSCLALSPGAALSLTPNPSEGTSHSLPLGAVPALRIPRPAPSEVMSPWTPDGHRAARGCSEGQPDRFQEPSAGSGTGRPPVPQRKHFITGSPARRRGWKWPRERKPHRVSQTSALEASSPRTGHVGLAHWGVYGNTGPEAGPAAGLGSPEAPPDLKVPAWQETSKAAAEALFSSPPTWGVES